MSEVAQNEQMNGQQTNTDANQNKKSVNDYNLMAIGEAIYDLKLEQAVLGDGNASHRQNNDALRTGFASMFTLLAHKEANDQQAFNQEALSNIDPEIKAVAQSLFNHDNNESTKRIVNTFEKTLKASVLDKQLWETAIPQNEARKAKMEADRKEYEAVRMIVSASSSATTANGSGNGAGGVFLGVLEVEPKVERHDHHYTREIHTPETRSMRRRSRLNTALLTIGLVGGTIAAAVGFNELKEIKTSIKTTSDTTQNMIHVSDSARKAQAEFNHNDVTKQIDTVQTKQQQTLNSVARMRRVVNTMSKNIDSVKANTAPVADTAAALVPTFN